MTHENLDSQSTPIRVSNWKSKIGWLLSALVVLMMLLDGAVKLTMAPQVVAAITEIGFPISLTRPLGLLILACVTLYAIPRTSVLGAILLTGFLGGATAAKTRLEDPFLFLPVAIGIMAWLGLYLRDERLRALLPLTTSPANRKN